MNDQRDERKGDRAPQAGKEITITIDAMKIDEPETFTFEKTMKVGEVAEEAADEFGYDDDGFTLQRGEEVLDSDKPLVAAGVTGKQVLDLVNTGGGVVR